MLDKNTKYTLKEIIDAVGLPVFIEKGSWFNGFRYLVESIDENGRTHGTPYIGNNVYQGTRTYSYILSDVFYYSGKLSEANDEDEDENVSEDVKDLVDEGDNEEEPEEVSLINDPDFFFNEEIMNGSYFQLVRSSRYDMTYIRVLVINYLGLIKRKLHLISGEESFRLKSLELFPAFSNNTFSFLDRNKLTVLLEALFDYSRLKPQKRYSRENFYVERKCDLVFSNFSTEIKFGSIRYYPKFCGQNYEITTFGVFALINAFLTEEERKTLAFDLLNENSGRCQYYLSTLLQKLPAAKQVDTISSPELLREETILSLYVQRALIRYEFNAGDEMISQAIAKYINDGSFITDKREYSLANIAFTINEFYDFRPPEVQAVLDELYAIAINRKYYNYIVKSSGRVDTRFLRNAEKFANRIISLNEKLITANDESLLYSYASVHSLTAINNEQKSELKQLYNSSSYEFGKLNIELYNVSGHIVDVLYDDALLNGYKWFFRLHQEDELEVEAESGYVFNGWEEKLISDTEIARITLYTDVCCEADTEEFVETVNTENPTTDMVAENAKYEEESSELDAVIDESDEEFDEHLSTTFFNEMECVSRIGEPLRDVFYTQKYIKSKKNADSELQDKIKLIEKKFAYLTENELRTYLNSQNSKHLQGRSSKQIPFYKFRVSRAARLFFCYGSDLQIRDKNHCKGTIILNELVVDHDAQEKAGNSRISTVYKFDEFYYDEEKGLGLDNKALVYDARTALPLLSDEQNGCVLLTPPCEIRGSAGSGKTSIAVEMYRKAYQFNPNHNILYVANSAPLVRTIKDHLEEAGVPNPECKVFGELCDRDYHRLTVADNKTYAKCIASMYNGRKKYSRINPDVFSMCFNSGIRGSESLATINRRIVRKDEFLNGVAKKENLESDEAELIYELAEKYDAYLEQNSIVDNNDLARKLLARSSSSKKYDLIIVDEVQDMTSLQIQALINCCKDYNICFLGDRNQVVTPSTFDFGELERGIYGKLGDRRTASHLLKKTYRCGERLISYLNGLNRIRRVKIAASNLEDDAIEESMRGDSDDSMFALLVTKDSVIEFFLKRAMQMAQCCIIVDNEATKQALTEKYGEAPNIVTVEEAKGLEYDTVVLYNFVKDNKEYFNDIFGDSGVAKKSTVHRIVFNKYYVSCTRAVDKIVICESEEFADDFKDTLFNGLEVKNNLGELNSYLNPSVDTWFFEAKKLYDEKKMYEQAGKYLNKYISFNPSPINEEYEKYRELCDYHKLLVESHDNESWRDCATVFEQFGDYSSALDVYENYIHDDYRTFLMKLQKHEAEYYIANPKELKRILETNRISKKDASIIIKRQFIRNQLKRINNSIANLAEVMNSGE